MVFSRKTHIIILTSLALVVFGYVLPETICIPVKGASAKDWNQDTFWREPWGTSGVHKGVDIFAPLQTTVFAATYGVVVFSGKLGIGGNVVAILGPKWRVHYYAHLAQINTHFGMLVKNAESIGTVGRSGNAKDKPPHLHYSIVSIFPYVWNWDNSTQGWKKMFFLDPSKKLVTKWRVE